MPRTNRQHPLKLQRRKTPALSVVAGRPVNQASGDVVAVSPLALGGSLHVQRLTRMVKIFVASFRQCFKNSDKPEKTGMFAFLPTPGGAGSIWPRCRLVL